MEANLGVLEIVERRLVSLVRLLQFVHHQVAMACNYVSIISAIRVVGPLPKLLHASPALWSNLTICCKNDAASAYLSSALKTLAMDCRASRELSL